MVPYNCALKSLFVTSLLYLCLLNINTTNSINHGLTVVWKFFIVRIFCFWNKYFYLPYLSTAEIVFCIMILVFLWAVLNHLVFFTFGHWTLNLPQKLIRYFQSPEECPVPLIIQLFVPVDLTLVRFKLVLCGFQSNLSWDCMVGRIITAFLCCFRHSQHLTLFLKGGLSMTPS